VAEGKEHQLLKLLDRHGYEAISVDSFGVRTFHLDGCGEIRLYPVTSNAIAIQHMRRIDADMTARDPIYAEIARIEQAEWVASEHLRIEAKHAAEALVKDLRLGGAAAGLTEQQVEALNRRTEQLLAEHRRFERLVRNRPLQDCA
jgi:hypothetical protein